MSLAILFFVCFGDRPAARRDSPASQSQPVSSVSQPGQPARPWKTSHLCSPRAQRGESRICISMREEVHVCHGGRKGASYREVQLSSGTSPSQSTRWANRHTYIHTCDNTRALLRRTGLSLEGCPLIAHCWFNRGFEERGERKKKKKDAGRM